mgnify:CR=1 FL=1
MSSKQGYSDLITRIRNGYRANLVSVSFVHTSRNVRLLRVLRDGGFISGWSERVASNIESKNVKDLSLSNFTKGTVFLRYVDGVPALLSIETISKQSRRVYLTLSEIEVFFDEEGFAFRPVGSDACRAPATPRKSPGAVPIAHSAWASRSSPAIARLG